MQAIEAAQRLLSFDPAHESVHRMLMRLYIEQGSRGAAIRQYQWCVASVQRELGTDPDSETRKLYDAMVRRADRGSGHALQRPSKMASARIPSLGGAIARHESPLVGREEPLGDLRRAVDAACSGAALRLRHR